MSISQIQQAQDNDHTINNSQRQPFIWDQFTLQKVRMALDCASVQALAMALQALSAALAVSAVSLNLPQFWQSKPKVWFAQAETVFATREILTQKTRFGYIVQALDNIMADWVSKIIQNPSAELNDLIKWRLSTKPLANPRRQKRRFPASTAFRPSQDMENLNANAMALF